MTLEGSPIERPESLSSVVYDAVRNLIIQQVLPPGSRVSEAMLAERLNVSKTPVREALLRLSQSGLVIADGRRGGRIPDQSVDRLRSAYEWREAVEAKAANLAAGAHTATDRDAMTSAADACMAAARIEDMDAFRAHDRAFHIAVATAADNPYLLTNVADSYDLVWMLRLRDSPASGDVVYTAGEHTAITAAILDRDPAVARSLMETHIHNVQSFVLGSIAEAAV